MLFRSESRELTFNSDVTEIAALERVLDRLAGEVCAGLVAEGLAGRTVTMKLRLAPFRTFTRSRTLSAPTDRAEVVARIGRELLHAFAPEDPVRLIGIGVSSLQPAASADAGIQAALPLGI